jgi:glutathione S-transferase
MVESEPEAEAKTTTTTFTYWNGRGKAESIRVLLAVCGEDYKEHVPDYDPDVTHITKKEHVDTLREDGYLLMNQLPLLCIDGLKLVQSGAIIRYLAKKHNLCGNDAEEEVMCDMLNESITDWRQMSVSAFEFTLSYEPTEEQLTKLHKANAKYLPLFERRLKCQQQQQKDGSSSLFLVGDNYTYPDFRLWELLEEIESHHDSSSFENEYPLVKAFHQQMKQHECIKAFLESDKRKSKNQDGIANYKKTVMSTLGY